MQVARSCHQITPSSCLHELEAVVEPLLQWLSVHLQSFIQRAGPEILVRDLPPKHEYVLALAPTPTQSNLLQHFLDVIEGQRGSMSLFRDYRMMRKILDTRDHGYADMLQVGACISQPMVSLDVYIPDECCNIL